MHSNYYYLNYSDYIYCFKKKPKKKISGNEITNMVDDEENSEEKIIEESNFLLNEINTDDDIEYEYFQNKKEIINDDIYNLKKKRLKIF